MASAARRRVTLDLTDVAESLDMATPEVSGYLDLETGEVIRVSLEVRDERDAIYAELPREPMDAPAHQAAFAAALDARDLHDWEREALIEADAIESGWLTRYLPLPAQDSREGYADMQAFIATITSPRLEEVLAIAIRGRGAFRRFEDVLYANPAEKERWFAFRVARARERVIDWLSGEGVEPRDRGPDRSRRGR